MPVLVLINGAPGAGKSTLAAALVQDRPQALALDIDQIKHSLGGWADDPQSSGLQARRITLAMVRQQLGDGFDVVIGQYLARTEFIDALEELAREVGARFVQAILIVEPEELARRLEQRRCRPDRPEQPLNDRHPVTAAAGVRSIEALGAVRPEAVRVDAQGAAEDVLARLRRATGFPGGHRRHS